MRKRILNVGIGGSGCRIVESVAVKLEQLNSSVSYMTMDTDLRDLEKMSPSHAISMVSARKMGEIFDELPSVLKEQWFPDSSVFFQNGFWKSLDMGKGASMWRTKALLAFYDFLSNEDRRQNFHAQIDELAQDLSDGESLQINLVASFAGGTGSGLLLPVALYFKKYCKEKFNVIPQVVAYCACPNVFEASLSQEQGVKANANAYATLREINAVQMVTAKQQSNESNLSVHFALGSEQDPIFGLLFDSEKEQFQSLEGAAFHTIYVFEREAGVSSLAVNENVVVELLTEKCRESEEIVSQLEKLNTRKGGALFRTASFASISYPRESIVEYVAKRSIADAVCGKWAYLPQKVNREMVLRCKTAIGEGYYYQDNVENYRKIVMQVGRDCLLESDEEDALYGDDLSGTQKGEQTKLSFYGYFDQINDVVRAMVQTDELKQIETLLLKKDQEEGKKVKPQKQLKEDANTFAASLKAFYLSAVRCSDEKEEEFKDLLQSGENSVVENILKIDGEFINPVYALVRLSAFAEDLESLIEQRTLLTQEQKRYKELECPTFYFDLAPLNVKSKYAKGGKTRFISLSEGEKGACSNKKTEKSLVFADMKEIFASVKRAILSNFYIYVLQIVNEYIQKYRLFFEDIEEITSEIRTELHLALVKNSKRLGMYLNVGATEEEKEQTYSLFKQEEGEGYLRTVEQTLNASSADYILQIGESVRAQDFMPCFNENVRFAVETFKNERYYQEQINQDILQNLLGTAGCDEKKRDNGWMQIRKAVGVTRPSLRTDLTGVPLNANSVVSRKILLLSQKSYDFLQNKYGSDERAESLIMQVLFDVGEYDSKVIFDETVPSDCIYIVSEIVNIKAEYIAFANEKTTESSGFRSFEKSLNVMNEQGTPLWNPYLLWGLHKGCKLPLINPQLQNKQEMAVANVLLYGFINGYICLQKGEGTRKKSYFYLDNGKLLPILCKEEQIKEGELLRLIEWLQDNDELVERWKETFEKQLSSELGELPMLGMGELSLRALYRAVFNSPVIVGLKKHLFALSYQMKGLEANAYHAKLLLKAGYLHFFRFCREKYPEKGIDYLGLYIGLLTDFIKEFFRSFKEDERQKGLEFVSWLDENGLFLSQSAYGQPCNIDMQSILESIR